MKKIIKLTERDLTRIIERVINESETPGPEMPETPTQEYLDLISQSDENDKENDINSNTQQVAEYWKRKKNYQKKYY